VKGNKIIEMTEEVDECIILRQNITQIFNSLYNLLYLESDARQNQND